MTSRISYKTISIPGESLFKASGSKFLGFSIGVENEEDVVDNLARLKRQYHEASHHCFAYSIGLDQPNIRTNDDGEPNHSAGDPILGQIRSYGLDNVLLVVIRYFGGTKLGVSGLISAYKNAAKFALEDATILNLSIRDELRLKFSYESTNVVQRILERSEFKILEQKYEEDCILTVSIPRQYYAKAVNELQVQKDVGYKIWFEMITSL